ncbi:unnamed protein product [Trifolium pratense]|uniref:Uncharacterized protein n=1 Tax=Trifolium pratense TaxID=57577 RepID=A0ACB0K8V1_TRIPR|nr:unnamed protein product [Trifolium pratense]
MQTECKHSDVVCFNCKEEGHIGSQCTKPKRAQSGGKVFALAGTQTASEDRLIRGTCFINHIPLITIIDTGATHCFVAADCVSRLGLKLSSMNGEMVIETPAKGSVTTSLVCSRCLLSMFGEVELVTTKQLKRLALEGNQLFSLMASLSIENQAVIDKLPVVCEFPEVFPDEIPEVPPEREVEFSIDLVPGTKPVSMAPYHVPEWKWDSISMDFVTSLPSTPSGFDSIWVIVDRLTKSAHFIPINISFPVAKLAEIYIRVIVKLHGVPSSIVSDRDPRFTSRFWKSLQEALGSKLRLSSAYHPQTDSQSERTIQSLEDLLRVCVLEHGGAWDSHLPLIEFTYNNSYHSSIGMAPFEALYGRRCRTPLCWFESGESVVLGPEIVRQTTEKVKLIREKMKASQSRQKSYHDKRRKDLEFQEGDHVFLRVTPVTGVGRALKSKKLTPRFIGPYQISERVGTVAYRVGLPPHLSNLHYVFHVSQLRRYVADPSHVVPRDDVEVRDNLTIETMPIRIEAREVKKLRGKEIPLVKVVWSGTTGESLTWELESKMRESYPELFA